MLNDKVRDLLDNPRVFAALGTTFKDGSPHVTPMWFDHEDETICFNSAIGRIKTRQLDRDPRVSLTLIDLDNPYGYVELRGRVRSVAGQEAEDHIDRLAKKYIGRDTYPWRTPGEDRIKYFLDIDHIAGM
jgi:PPOX class probable F420-dependent enzyme